MNKFSSTPWAIARTNHCQDSFMKPPVRRTIVPLTIAALAGGACADSGDPAPAPPEESTPDFETPDTAGVPIVENARPPADSRLDWRMGEQPALSIGEIDGPDPYLLDISDVIRMPDGRIIVADRASGELRAFDTLGVHLATWGGSGEGPGEFINLISVDPWPGDSLVARWSQGNRLTVFDSQGNYGRVFRHAGPGPHLCRHSAAGGSDPRFAIGSLRDVP